MSDKTFRSEILWGGQALPVRVVAFDETEAGGHFVSVNFGQSSFGETKILATPESVRALAKILNAAADFADPRVVSAADLGLEAA